MRLCEAAFLPFGRRPHRLKLGEKKERSGVGGGFGWKEEKKKWKKSLPLPPILISLLRPARAATVHQNPLEGKEEEILPTSHLSRQQRISPSLSLEIKYRERRRPSCLPCCVLPTGNRKKEATTRQCVCVREREGKRNLLTTSVKRQRLSKLSLSPKKDLILPPVFSRELRRRLRKKSKVRRRRRKRRLETATGFVEEEEEKESRQQVSFQIRAEGRRVNRLRHGGEERRRPPFSSSLLVSSSPASIARGHFRVIFVTAGEAGKGRPLCCVATGEREREKEQEDKR